MTSENNKEQSRNRAYSAYLNSQLQLIGQLQLQLGSPNTFGYAEATNRDAGQLFPKALPLALPTHPPSLAKQPRSQQGLWISPRSAETHD
jgi:hypothetical protein